jgi:hypothetical protein
MVRYFERTLWPGWGFDLKLAGEAGRELKQVF